METDHQHQRKEEHPNLECPNLVNQDRCYEWPCTLTPRSLAAWETDLLTSYRKVRGKMPCLSRQTKSYILVNFFFNL